MIWIALGDRDAELGEEDLKTALREVLRQLGAKKKVLVIPPDITRLHSRAGFLTREIRNYYGDALTDILPALGTHTPLTAAERIRMFGDVPSRLYRNHDWRNDTELLGRVPADYIREVSGGTVDFPVALEVNRLLVRGSHDLILSVGQVVPHEVVGMANGNKNIFVGIGGADCINRSHFLGAACGMENIMGRADTPVRRVLDYGSEHFLKDFPLVYLLTVVSPDASGSLKVRGFFAGDDGEVFRQAAELSFQVNVSLLDKPLEKVVVYLDPEEYRSTWLGNKAIYRTRMALSDGGELIILAPGVKDFGEDAGIDALIRRYGYAGREEILSLTERQKDLKENLCAAAHLIHGSSDGRFRVTYAPGGLSRQEVEAAGFSYADLGAMMKLYNPDTLKNGWNSLPSGEEVFYISNPALGLWARRISFSGVMSRRTPT